MKSEGKTTLNCETFAASISSLRSLSLVRTEMSVAQLSAIFEVLSKNKLSLKYLDLSENDLITVNSNQIGKEMERFFRWIVLWHWLIILNLNFSRWVGAENWNRNIGWSQFIKRASGGNFNQDHLGRKSEEKLESS